MDRFRNFDEIAALSSVGLTPGSLVRTITREDALTERARSWRFDGNGCALESARRGATPGMVGHWIATACRKLRAMPSRPGVPVPAAVTPLDELKAMQVDYAMLGELLDQLAADYLKNWVDRSSR